MAADPDQVQVESPMPAGEGEEGIPPGCWILTESREFIGRVFSFLPAKTLNTCSRVCQVWRLEADRVLSRRKDIGWVTLGRKEAEEYVDKPSSPGVDDELGPFGVHLNTCLNSIGSIPRLAIVFSECQYPSEFQTLQCDYERTSGHSRKKTIKMIHSRLPTDCQIVGLRVNGTIGCQRDLSPAGESEGQMGSACVLLPEINFRRTCHTDGPRPDPVYRPDTKCFLVFSPGGLHNTSARMIKQLQQHMYTEHGCLPVIAGGIVKQVWIEPFPSSSSNRYKKAECSILSFYGPNVNAASVLLGRSITTRDAARRKMLELKKAGLSEKRSLAFMFSCIGRGREFYNEPDVESEVFHELFPKTPLIGFFGGGEYGCDNLTCGKVIKDTDDGIRNNGGHQKGLSQSLTCVICLLSFG
ncbi:F-box only protein 22-like [Asterias amurensis]|uniref:F-box only protein 22-like n=1 Tax=Asterias amurensis TaxID=7602 RepID=UPI003AB915E5